MDDKRTLQESQEAASIKETKTNSHEGFWEAVDPTLHKQKQVTQRPEHSGCQVHLAINDVCVNP